MLFGFRLPIQDHLVSESTVLENILCQIYRSTTVYYFHYLPNRKVMAIKFSVKIFDIEFSADLYILRSPESKKVVLGNWSIRMYVCAYVYDSVGSIQHFISPKLITLKTQNFLHTIK